MNNPIIESPKVVEEDETVQQENDVEADVVAGPTTSIQSSSIIDYRAKKSSRDNRPKKKDEKTVQQVLKSLDSLKTPEEKLSAMCKKYSELLHENRQLQATVKQSEKNITMIHREKEQFRHERSKALLAKTRMEQLCRELQKLNKAQKEETVLKLKVGEEKRKEIYFTFQNAFAEINTLNNQNNEKSAMIKEENLEMREKIKSVCESIEWTKAQLDKVRHQSSLELELAEKKYLKSTLELTAEKEALMEDKRQLLLKLAQYHVRIKEQEVTEQCLRKQIAICEEKFEQFQHDVKKATDLLNKFESLPQETKKKMLKLERESALWKQRWEKTNATVLQMSKLKEKRDAEMVTLNNKLSTLQELCKNFQRERTSLIAQLREKNGDDAQVDHKPLTDANLKCTKQIESITKDCENSKDNLSKTETSLAEAVRENLRSTSNEGESNESTKGNKKVTKKSKKAARKKSNQKKEETAWLSDETKVEVTNDSKNNETSEKLEKMGNTSELDKIGASDTEIAILERHEIVLKDIEKVLAEQAILEAKIALVKEMGKSITDTDDSKANQMNSKVTELPEISAIESEMSEIMIKNEKTEITKSPELARDMKDLIDQDEMISDLEKISPNEFVTVSCDSKPDTVTSVSERTELADKAKIVNTETTENLEESTKTLYPCIDSQPIETESMKIESTIARVKLENDEKLTEKTEIMRTIDLTSLEIESIPKIQALVSMTEVTDEKMDSPSNNPVL